MNSTKEVNGIIQYELNSWEEFSGFILENHSNCPAFIYRGQSNAEWKIESTLDRLEKRYPRTPNYTLDRNPEYFECPPTLREVHLKAFKNAVQGKRSANPPKLTDDEWWVLAQQHGLATPMLDWTLSPFVALFFAFEHNNCHNPNQEYITPKKRAVLCLLSSWNMIKNPPDKSAPRLFLPTKETSYRLLNQCGVFLKMPPGSDLESYIENNWECNQATVEILQKIIISTKYPNKDRIECLKYLNKMNINRMSLFPDIDGAASYINSLWELDFDTSLGYLPDNLD
ncbi:MAG: FRG domain-containing protein [Candidatus Omnitrophota bacterium]